MIEYVHKSDVSKLKSCSQAFYYDRVLRADAEFINETALAGNAFHKFCKEIYISELPNKWTKFDFWCQWFVDELTNQKEQATKDGIDINSPEDLHAEEYLEMVCEFLKQPYNINAKPLLLEAPFRFHIKRGRKVYKFEGAIDQLLQIPTRDLKHIVLHMFSSCKDIDYFNTHEYVWIHRDIKTGDKKPMNELTLLTNEDIMWYSYGLAFGVFNINGNWQPISRHGQFIPFAHALYYTRDHLRYKRGSRDGTKPAGSYRGQGMYFLRRDINDLRKMEEQLINWHNKINTTIYTRDAAGTMLCNWCEHNTKCLYELKGS